MRLDRIHLGNPIGPRLSVGVVDLELLVSRQCNLNQFLLRMVLDQVTLELLMGRQFHMA